jgi:Patatin-like phospholipase
LFDSLSPESMMEDQPNSAHLQLSEEAHLDPAPLASDAPPSTTTSQNISLLHSLRHHFGDVVRYLYFMRFSLFLWLSMIVLALADRVPAVASISRGILTPFSPWQWFFTGFAVVLPGWFALLAARIVCAYGEDRFGAAPPPFFHVPNRMRWFVFWGAQVPGLFLLYRIASNVVHENERHHDWVYACLFAGAFAALLFWYIVAILYYWMWNPDTVIPARAFVVPKWRRLPLEEIEKLPRSSSIRLFGKFLGRLGRLGPGYRTHKLVNPGHIVASIAFICAVVLYLLLMPISAPIPVPHLAWAARIVAIGFALYVLLDFFVPSWKGLANTRASFGARWLPIVSSFIILLLLLFAAVQPHAPRVIPVIAYVVILLMVIFWTLAGVAFFADYYRLPVFTLAIASVLALNHWPAEHVFPAEPLTAADQKQLHDPAYFVIRTAGEDNVQPVVIITATGGGIHAAAWTATVLRALDKEFGDLELHNHILLMSTVSGGSVAAAGFLREYFTGQPFNDDSYNRIQGAAACSSLQAVAWGLAYPDTLRLFFPWFFNIFPTLDRFDRGWALQKAIDRNLHDSECIKDEQSREAGAPDLSNFTLNALSQLDPNSPPCADHKDACQHFPAFTLNTTVVETGDRFLLSNYSVFASKDSDPFEVLPAASFLGVYGRESILPVSNPVSIPNRGGYADLSLLTAARLSASFTYVSPAARLPFEKSQGTKQNAYHFVDGGYYDNDGTNSAIEFLQAASTAFSPQHPLRVLLIEIRNTDDINVNDSPDSYGYQAGLKWNEGAWSKQAESKRRFGPLDQLAAPPEAALYAGFSSVTRRNRRELQTLQRSLCGSLELDHVVLDYQQRTEYKPGTAEIDQDESEVDQPLSWHLTQRQQDWIEGQENNALDRKQPISDRVKIQGAVKWLKEAQAKKGAPIIASDACRGQFPVSAVTSAK